MDMIDVPSDWANENARGRETAEQLIQRIQAENNPVLLVRAVQAMISRGEYGGVEVGFFHQIGSRLL